VAEEPSTEAPEAVDAEDTEGAEALDESEAPDPQQ